MIWYPKDDFDAAGYTVPTTFDELIALSDQMVADGEHAVVRRLRVRQRHRLAGDRLDGRHHAPHGGAGRLRPVGDPRDPVQRPGGQTAAQTFGDVMFKDGYVLGGARDTPSIAFGAAPLPMFDDPPGCWLHRQANFIMAPLLPGGRRVRGGLRLVPVPDDRPGGDAAAGSSR